MCAAPTARAFTLDSYAEESALNRGKWVKISVDRGGMHCIPASTLSSWGFSDPSRVRVHGYGGAMLPDELVPDDYIDDLPRVASRLTAKGLVFYAVGPQQVNLDSEISISHAVNPYSNYGYYFLTEGDAATPAPQKGGTALTSASGCVTSALALSYYDPQQVSVGNTGRMMVGEDFKAQNSREFKLPLPDRIENIDVKLRVCLVANNPKQATPVRLTVNGKQLPAANDRIEKVTSDGVYTAMTTLNKTVAIAGKEAAVTVSLTTSAELKSAWLNYIEAAYQRRLTGSQVFQVSDPNVCSAGACRQRAPRLGRHRPAQLL